MGVQFQWNWNPSQQGGTAASSKHRGRWRRKLSLLRINKLTQTELIGCAVNYELARAVPKNILSPERLHTP